MSNFSNMYRLVYVNKHGDKNKLFFDTYEEAEYNFAHCEFSPNIQTAKVQVSVGVFRWKTLLNF